MPNPPLNPIPPQTMTLTQGCNAVDAGQLLPNVHDNRVVGSAPDLGAYDAAWAEEATTLDSGPVGRVINYAKGELEGAIDAGLLRTFREFLDDLAEPLVIDLHLELFVEAVGEL